MTAYKRARPNPYRDVIDRATLFTSIVFMGTGKYDRREYPTLAEAQEGALPHARERNKPAMIYAVAGCRQAFVETVYPSGSHILGDLARDATFPSLAKRADKAGD